MKAVLALIMASIALVGLLNTFADEPDTSSDKIYGTQSAATMRVIVAKEFQERGTHYIPKQTKFADFLKTLHERDDAHLERSHTAHVRRNGKHVCESYNDLLRGLKKQDKEQFERFMLEDGDSVGITEYSI